MCWREFIFWSSLCGVQNVSCTLKGFSYFRLGEFNSMIFVETVFCAFCLLEDEAEKCIHLAVDSGCFKVQVKRWYRQVPTNENKSSVHKADAHWYGMRYQCWKPGQGLILGTRRHQQSIKRRKKLGMEAYIRDPNKEADRSKIRGYLCGGIILSIHCKDLLCDLI